jgi:hypothetical protein
MFGAEAVPHLERIILTRREGGNKIDVIVPNPMIILGLVLMIAGMVCGRLFAERAMKLLSSTEKLALLDSFSRMRVFGSLPLLFVFFCFGGVEYLPSGWRWTGYLTLWFLLTSGTFSR